MGPEGAGICDEESVVKYYNTLSFDKQLELLVKIAERLKYPAVGHPIKGACNEDSVLVFFRSLSPQERLETLHKMISTMKNVPNINNNNQNLPEVSNEEVQAAYNALENNAAKGGKRRKHRKLRKSRKSRKASRRRLTRRRG